MVDEPLVAGRAVYALEHDRRVRAIPVVVLQEDRDAVVPRQVRPVERIGRERGRAELEEPVGMLDDPARVDAHVVRDHVARQPDTAIPGASSQIRRCPRTAEIGRYDVVVERIGGRQRVRVAAPPLDLL